MKSLAGEPCRIRPSLPGEVKSTLPLKALGDGLYEIDVKKGETAMLYAGDPAPVYDMAAVPFEPREATTLVVKQQSQEWIRRGNHE